MKVSNTTYEKFFKKITKSKKPKNGLADKSQDNKAKRNEEDLKELANLLRMEPKPSTIFSEIISLFQNNKKLLNILNMIGYIEPDFIQIENNLWSFFTVCRFENSSIIIGKAHYYKYMYKEGEPEENIEIRDDFIKYMFSKIN